MVDLFKCSNCVAWQDDPENRCPHDDEVKDSENHCEYPEGGS